MNEVRPPTDRVTQDLAIFAEIVERRAKATDSYPAQNAAQGLIQAWQILVAPEGRAYMPALRERVGEYVSGLGLSLEEIAAQTPPQGTIRKLSAAIIEEFNSAMPEESHINLPRGVAPLTGLVTARSAKGRPIMKAVRWVLGTDDFKWYDHRY